MDKYRLVFFPKFYKWNKFIFFITFIVLSFNLYCVSETMTIRVNSNYSIYKMLDLKALQSKLTSEMNEDDIPIKDIEKFPSYFSHEFQFLVNYTPERSLGFFYKINSTGARSHYQDYSGEYKIDYQIEANSFGVIYEAHTETERLQYPLGIKLLLINTDFLIKSSFTIENTGESEYTELRTVAKSFGVEPYTGIQYNIKGFNIRANVSYLITQAVKLHYHKDKDLILVDPDGDQVKVFWGGLNFGLSIGYSFR
jgi:hypothetical protein